MAIYCKNAPECEESTLDRSGFLDGTCDACWEQEQNPTTCPDCINERKEYGAQFCPQHYDEKADKARAERSEQRFSRIGTPRG